MTNYQIDTIIDGLRDAVRVCTDVDGLSEDYERSYPYAAGYARASMEHTIKTLLELKNNES